MKSVTFTHFIDEFHFLTVNKCNGNIFHLMFAPICANAFEAISLTFVLPGAARSFTL